MTIRYATTATSIGALLVAAEEDGICDIVLGDSPSEIVDEFLRAHPGAERSDDSEIRSWLASVESGVEQPLVFPDLPLIVRGTDFQIKVWRALQAIPPGETRSYTELGNELGMTTGARAIAGACAANRLAVAVPCHRVVRSDGSLSGYRWGVARKATLLEREKNQ